MAVFESPTPITTAEAAGTAVPKPIAQTIDTNTRDIRLDIRGLTFPPVKALEFHGAATDHDVTGPLPATSPVIP
jgi:hypothetical protein